LKRKTSHLPSRVYNYGCLPPTENAEAVDNILRLEHAYYNRIIEIMRDLRLRFREARAKVAPELDALEQKCDELAKRKKALRDEMKAVRKKARKRVACPELQAEVRAIEAELKPARDTFKAQRKRVDAELKPSKALYVERVQAVCIAEGRVNPDGTASKAPQTRKRVNALVAAEMLADDEMPEFWRETFGNERQALAKVKEARAHCGLEHGCYLRVEEAATLACRMSKRDLPRFKRYMGTGTIAVELRKQTTDTVLCGTSNYVRIEPLPADTWTKEDGKRDRHGCRKAYTTVRIRVGKTSAGEPIWATFPILMHRPLPAGAPVKWAWVKIWRCGNRKRYNLQVTLESEQFLPENRPCGEGTMAIDLGWRVLPNGRIRVGYGVDDQGNHWRESPGAEPGFILPGARPENGRAATLPATNLPPKRALRERIEYVETLRSHGDLWFDRAKARTVAWLKEQTQHEDMGNKSCVPDWMRADTEHIGKWHAHHKLARVAYRWVRELITEERIRSLWVEWRTERLASKQDLMGDCNDIGAWFAAHGVEDEPCRFALWLEWWRRKNAHLYQWERAQDHKARGARRDLYRCWAARLARTHKTIVMEDFEISKVAKKPKSEDSPQNKKANAIRQMVAVSEFRLAILSAVGEKRLCREPPEDTTRQCTHCGHLPKRGVNVHAAETIVLTCAKCERSEDQDKRGAINLLRRHFDGYGKDPQHAQPAPAGSTVCGRPGPSVEAKRPTPQAKKSVSTRHASGEVAHEIAGPLDRL
jgi:hypothetical protein